MINPFKIVINQLNNEIRADSKKELNAQQKKKLFNQTKMYIFLQDFIEKIKPYLEEDETIQAYLPMTNDGQNVSAVGLGLLGMYHPESEEAKAYVKDFNDLRGNRLLIFTDQRMIFTTIIEFLDQKTFFSYPYTTIKAITLKENKTSYFDWDDSFPPKRVALFSYTFDFESENHIFSEMLGQRDADILKRQLSDIPGLKEIFVTTKFTANEHLTESSTTLF
ncbi:PH domain-containing protein [Enterococcus crotali]|uniref:PH domain-containing protein n=1 Tax=Enterococcus crotali TaxID=1453587 RepID=UPI000AF60C85|nr:PH domain-containing protein [Enterococcus crotali]